MQKSILILAAMIVSFGSGFAFNSMISRQSSPPAVGRVTGIGGVFFKCKDPKKVKQWYKAHLGLNTDQYGTTFEWRQAADSTRKGFTQWSAFSEKTKYFDPSTRDFMINYRVENLNALLQDFKRDSVTVTDTVESYSYGRFVHIMDIEGNKIELWEPNDTEYGKIQGSTTK